MVEDKKDTLDVHQKKTKDSRNRSSNGQQYTTAKDFNSKS